MDQTGRCFVPNIQNFHRSKILNCFLQNVTQILEQSMVTMFNYSENSNAGNLNIRNNVDDIKQEIVYSAVENANASADVNWSKFQIFVILGTIWLIDRFLLKTLVIQQWTEAIVAWILVFMTLPLLIPVGIVLFLVRFTLTLKFRQNGGKYELMNPFDAVWSFENPKSPSTCLGLYVIKGHGELERIRDLLRIRVLEKVDSRGRRIYDRFRWSIVTVFGFVCWEKNGDFNINNHIRYCETPNKGPESEWTEQDLFDAIGHFHDLSLIQPGKSPWEILIIPKFKVKSSLTDENHYAILFRIHHSIGDGISMGHILHQCIADEPFNFSVDPISPLKFSKLTIAFSYMVSFLLMPQITIRNLLFLEGNAFHTEKILTGPKTVNWSRPICLSGIKELKNKTNTSVFTVLLSCLTGAMRSLYKKHGHPIPELIYAAPPIAILPYPDRNPRNRFSVVLYPLATGKEHPVERLDAIFKASKQLASSPDVVANYFVIYLMGILPFQLLKILQPLAHATISFSNIPGPTNKVRVFNGDELAEIGAWIPIKNRIGIAMGLFSYNDKLRVTFIADHVCLPNINDVELLCEYFETELVTLAQAVGSSSKTQIFI